MSLPTRFSRCAAALLACGAACSALGADTPDASVMYRCPGNDYKNTITAKEAEHLGCKRLEGAPVTVIQMTKPRPATRRCRRPVPAVPASIRSRSGRATAMPAASSKASCKTEEDKLAAMQKEFNNGEPERQGDEKNYQKYLDRVDDMRAAIARKQIDIAAIQREIKKLPPPLPRDRADPPPPSPGSPTRQAAAQAALDLLATMVAVVTPEGECEFANSSFETVLGLSRRTHDARLVFDWFVDPQVLRDTVVAVSNNAFSTSRLEALLKRPSAAPATSLPVHVTVNQIDGSRNVVFEMVEIEQQNRQEREERALEQAEATKELIRNLAHEIKNPLGGIRGAAQLLEMEIESRTLTEYTQVIIKEADRLQLLVDRLLAPHRKPHVVGDVNIHEVCERVRALILAEFPRGLESRMRDYDTSIPEFSGDREQLIQAVLNITHNAAESLAEQIGAGNAQITLRTRVVRQVTFGKQRYRLALELHIEDNGPGVPEALREKIFFPLVSGREGGSGLGLTLAQTFVQQHHGTIEFDSEPGRTIFKIVIPLMA